MFVLDNSGSIRNRFGEVKNLVRAVVNGFDVNDNAAHFGVITYRENGTVTVPLALRTNRAALENEIDQLGDTARSCRNLCTNTGNGLLLAQMELDGPRHRPEAKKVIIVVTDGQANVGIVNNGLINFAGMLHADNIEIFAVGVTSETNEAELQGIGIKKTITCKSVPDCYNYFLGIKKTITCKSVLFT